MITEDKLTEARRLRAESDRLQVESGHLPRLALHGDAGAAEQLERSRERVSELRGRAASLEAEAERESRDRLASMSREEQNRVAEDERALFARAEAVCNFRRAELFRLGADSQPPGSAEVLRLARKVEMFVVDKFGEDGRRFRNLAVDAEFGISATPEGEIVSATAPSATPFGPSTASRLPEGA